MSIENKLVSEGLFSTQWTVWRRGTKICIEFECGSKYGAVVNADRLMELWEEDGFTLQGQGAHEFFLRIRKPHK